MKVRVLFFAALKEIVGEREMEIDLPPDATVGGLVETLVERYGGLRGRSYTTALNQRYCQLDAPLGEDDEIALIPPVSGG